MKIKRTVLLTAVLATTIGAQAATQVAVGSNTDGFTNVWTISNLNNNPPSASGQMGPSPSGALEAAGTLADDAAVTFTFTAGTNWNAALIDDIPAAYTNTGVVQVDCAVQGAGVDSKNFGNPNDKKDSAIGSQGTLEVLWIKVDTTNFTEKITLDTIGFRDIGGNDRGSIVIYNAASNTTETVYYDAVPADFTQEYEISSGSIIAIAGGESGGANWFRFKTLTFDIEYGGTNVVSPALVADAMNSQVELDWNDDLFPGFGYYTLSRSTSTNGPWNVIGTGSSFTNSAYTDLDVTNNVTYWYKATSSATNGYTSPESALVSATPFTATPNSLIVVPSIITDQRVELDWDDSAESDLYFGDYNVYRAGPNTTNNFALLASGVTNSSYVDTYELANDVTYYYWVSHVATNPVPPTESELIGPVAGIPTKNLVIVNYTGDGFGGASNQQHTPRAGLSTNTPPPYFDIDALSGNIINRIAASIIWFGDDPINYWCQRGVLRFGLNQERLGNRTADDIESVILRLYPQAGVPGDTGSLFALTNNTGGIGDSIEIYHALNLPYGSGGAADFENEPDGITRSGWELVGDLPGLTNGAASNQWYEIDVTAQALADLSDPLQDGSSYQVRLSEDVNFPTNWLQTVITTNDVGEDVINRLDVGVYFVNNVSEGLPYVPQLYVKYKDTRSGYLQWADLWLPNIVGPATVDFDADGLDNVTEYGLGGNPADGTTDSVVAPMLVMDGGTATYIHPKLTGDSNLVYTVETTTDLRYVPWTDTHYTVEGTSATGAALESVTNTIDDADTRFIRLKVEYYQ